MSRCGDCVNIAQDTTNKVASCNVCGEHGDMYVFDSIKAREILDQLVEK